MTTSLGVLGDKLAHPLLEVRIRTLRNVDFKIKNGLVTPDSIAQERSFLRQLLQCLALDNGPSTETVLLGLLRYLAAYPEVAKALIRAGAEDCLNSLRSARPPEVQNQVDQLLAALFSLPTKVHGPVVIGEKPTPTNRCLPLKGVSPDLSSTHDLGDRQRTHPCEHARLTRPSHHEVEQLVGMVRQELSEITAELNLPVKEWNKGRSSSGMIPTSKSDLHSGHSVHRELKTSPSPPPPPSTYQDERQLALPEGPLVREPEDDSQAANCCPDRDCFVHIRGGGIHPTNPTDHSGSLSTIITYLAPEFLASQQQGYNADHWQAGEEKLQGSCQESDPSSLGSAINATEEYMAHHRSYEPNLRNTIADPVGRSPACLGINALDCGPAVQLRPNEGVTLFPLHSRPGRDHGNKTSRCQPAGSIDSVGGSRCSQKVLKGAEKASHPTQPGALADPRLARACARADMRSNACTVLQDFSDMKPGALHLPFLVLGAADGQSLFESNVRLQYSTDPQVLQVALWEVLTNTLRDFPPEALLQQQGLLDNVLSLMNSTSGGPSVQRAAGQTMKALMARMKRALAMREDPSFLGSAARSCQASGRKSSTSLMVTSLLGTEGDDIGTTVPEGSYPSSRNQGDGTQRSTLVSCPLSDPASTVISISSVLHLVVIALAGSAAAPHHHIHVLPTLHDIMPLMTTVAAGMGQEEARSFWSPIFKTLDQSLASCRALTSARLDHKVDENMKDRVLDTPTVALLTVVVRFWKLLPAGLPCQVVIPQRTLSALAQLYMDDIVCLVLSPGLRDTLEDLMGEVSPNLVADMNKLEVMGKAIEAAEEVIHRVADLASPRTECATWLAHVDAALPSVGYGPKDQALLVAMTRGLAWLCGHEERGRDASRLLLRLLNHPQKQIQLAAYSLLSNMMMDGLHPTGPSWTQGDDYIAPPLLPSSLPLLAMIVQPDVMEHLVVRGLEDPAARPTVMDILTRIMMQGQEQATHAVLSWQPWISCYRQDAAATRMMEFVEDQTSAQRQSAGPLAWSHVEHCVRDLFHKDPPIRSNAAQMLRAAIQKDSSEEKMTSGDERVDEDPFWGFLDGSLRPDPTLDLMARPPSTRFAPEDVRNLVAVLMKPSLAAELRRSAAEQLLFLTMDRQSLPILTNPQVLDCLVQLATWRTKTQQLPSSGAALPSNMGHTEQQSYRDSSSGGASLADMQLPISCVNLLYALCCSSPTARQYLLADRGAPLMGLLPWMFHPMTSARRSCCRLLCILAFLPPALMCKALRCRAGEGPMDVLKETLKSPTFGCCLPSIFLKSYRFPFYVEEVAVAEQGTQDLAFMEYSAELHSLVCQRQAVVSSGLDLAVLRSRLEQDVESMAMDLGTRQLLAVRVQNLDLTSLMARSLQEMRTASSHETCSQAIAKLISLSASVEGTQALLSAGWEGAFENLLSSCPANEQDMELWHLLLALLEHLLLHPEGMSSEGYLYACRHVRGTLCPWLKKSGAAKAVGHVPLGISSEPLLESVGSRLKAVQLTELVLRVAAALLQSWQLHTESQDMLMLLDQLGVCDLVEVLGKSYVGQGDLDYGCHLQSLRVIRSLLEVLGILKGLAPDTLAMSPLLESLESPLLCLIHPLITKICVPKAGKQVSGFQGKALLKEAMTCLREICRLVPIAAWTIGWREVGGSFWLSRLARDREAEVRALAMQLVSLALAPGAEATQQMISRGWPDCISRMVKVLLDDKESYLVRTQVARVLTASLALPAGAMADQSRLQEQQGETEGHQEGSRLSLCRLGPAAVLQASHLWECVPSMIADNTATSQFLEAMAGLTLSVVWLDPGGVGTQILEDERAVDTLVRLCHDGDDIVAGGYNHRGNSSAWHLGDSWCYGFRLNDLRRSRQPADTKESGRHNQEHERGGHGRTLQGVPQEVATLTALLGNTISANSPQQKSRSGDAPCSNNSSTAGVGYATCTCSRYAIRICTIASGHHPVTGESVGTFRHPGQKSRVLTAVIKKLCTLGLSLKSGLKGWEDKAGPVEMQATSPPLVPTNNICVLDLSSIDSMRNHQHPGSGVRRDREYLHVMATAALAANELLQPADSASHLSETLGLTTLVKDAQTQAGYSLVLSLAAGMAHGAANRREKIALAALTGTLFSDAKMARLLIDTGSGHEHNIKPGVEVGEVLCVSLVELLPDSAFGIQDPSVSQRQTNPTLCQPSDLQHQVVITALRNLLAFSHAAKRTALQVGLPQILINTCMAFTQSDTPVKKAGISAEHSAKLARLKRRLPATTTTTTTTTRTTAASDGGVAGQLTSLKSITRKSKIPAGPAADAPSCQGTMRGDSCSQVPRYSLRQDKNSTSIKAIGPEQGSAHDPDSKVLDQDATVKPRCWVAAAPVPNGQLLLCLSLMCHLTFESPPSRQAMANTSHCLATLQRLWHPLRTQPAAFLELLLLLVSLTAGSASIAQQLFITGSQPLLVPLTQLMFDQYIDQSVLHAGTMLLLQLACCDSIRTLLVKTDFPQEAEKYFWSSVTRPGTGEPQRLAAVALVLSSLASTPETQHTLFSCCPSLLDVVIKLLDTTANNASDHVHRSALALIRNLSFHPDIRPLVLANSPLLAILIRHVEKGLEDVVAAGYAASSLWTLTYQGEKVKAALRRIPQVISKLVAVRGEAGAALEEQVSQSCWVPEVPCAGTGAACDGGGLFRSWDTSDCDRLHWWTSQLERSLSSLLDIMQSSEVGELPDFGR